YDFIFIGDSYGLQYSKSLEDKDVRVAGLFDHGCLILPNYSRWLNNKEDQTCSEEYGKVKSELKGNNKPLLLAHSWDSYQNKLVKKGSDEKLDIDIDGYYKIISDELKIIFNENGSDRKYFILGVPQRTKVDAFECLARTELLGFRYMNKCEESQIKVDMKINDYLMTFANNYSNVYFINPNDFLCDNEHCLIIKDREPIHSDKSHLSIYGSPIVSDGFISFMNSTLK
ncbi:TPA: SGNH hydrolase domain-containing protein, partial [Vibrio cholerae]